MRRAGARHTVADPGPRVGPAPPPLSDPMAVVYFVVLVGVLIFVHELGHFAWAKFFGVKVLKFSLGFGPRIAGVTRGETEYVVSAFPLGGYVRMLGESPNDTIASEDRGRALSDQPLWKRFIIVLAGPLMNLGFPLFLYFVVFLGDTQMTPPVIGGVYPDRPADGHLEPGDRIVAIDGDEITTWYELQQIVGPSAGEPLALTVERDGERFETTITPATSEERRPLDLTRSVGRLGIESRHPLAVIGIVSPTSPAAAAGLRTFDRVVAAGGRPIERWIELEEVLDRNRGSMLPITYLRPQRLTDVLTGLADLEVFEPHVATLTPESGPGSGPERAGIESADLYVWRVPVGSPEHAIGIRPGDRLVSLDSAPIRLWATFEEDLRIGAGQEHEIAWRHGDQEITRRLRLAHEHGTDEIGQRYDRYTLAIQNWVPARSEAPVANPSPFTYAVREAFRETREIIELTFTSMVWLFQGRLSMRTLGGPIEIFRVAGQAAREGPLDFLRFMAFISINLGLLNLLPIPMLDGGHLVFFTIEGVSRRPVSRRIRELASLAGLVFLILVMVLVMTNDITRGWPDIVATFESVE